MVSELKRDKIIGFYISIGALDWGEERVRNSSNLVEADGKPNASVQNLLSVWDTASHR